MFCIILRISILSFIPLVVCATAFDNYPFTLRSFTLVPRVFFLSCANLFLFVSRCTVACFFAFAQATAVVFDKTGTLTTGKSTITGVISLDEAWNADGVGAALQCVCRVCVSIRHLRIVNLPKVAICALWLAKG